MSSPAPRRARSSVLIDELAERLGEPRPAGRPEPGAPAARFDLTDAACVIDAGHAAIEQGLRHILRGPPDEVVVAALRARARDAVAAACDVPAAAIVCADGAAAARARAASQARSRTGRDAVVCVGTDAAIAVGAAVLAEDLGEALRMLADAGRYAAVIVEPWIAAGSEVDAGAGPDAELRQLRALCETARSRGVLVVLDESRTAFRVAATTVHAAGGIPADAVVLGESVACGLPFGAVVWTAGRSEGADSGSSDPERSHRASSGLPSAAVAAVAAVTVETLCREPVHERLAEIGESIRAAFRRSCEAARIDAALVGPAAALELRIRGQENAEAPLIAHHLQLELRRLGVEADRRMFPSLSMADSLDELARAIDGAVGRIRTLLIEHNAWLCGGLPWVFPTGDPRMRERGLAIYRYPGRAAVDVRPTDAAIRITFHEERSEETSSGFYVPTRIRGDFEVSVEYELRGWQPGPQVACLALFVQNELSTARYYAQRVSSSGDAGRHVVQAVLDGTVSERTPAGAARGAFRLTRSGSAVRSWHKENGASDWRLMGEKLDGSTDDVIVGAKIWSVEECSGLEADLRDLRIVARIPDDQIPPLAPRPDPRHTG